MAEHDPAGPHPGDWRLHDGDAVRAAAAVLIANSHLEAFYPRAWMAGDGLTGNALFYFLSGFGIALAASTRRQAYLPWLGRRAVRLYPPVILAGLLIQIGLAGDRHGWTARKVAEVFLFPTTYGYVGHIMLVYAGLYWLLRLKSRWPLAIAVALAAAGWLATYAGDAWHMSPGEHLALGQMSKPMHVCYFTAIALAGALFAPLARRPRGTLGRDAALLAVLFLAYVGLKFEMVRGVGSRAFVLLFVMVAALCPLAVRVSADDRLQAWLRRIRPTGWLVAMLAAATLEMYIVQTWTHEWVAVERLRFPLDLAAFWVVTVAGAVLLRGVTQAVMRSAGGRRTVAPVLPETDSK